MEDNANKKKATRLIPAMMLTLTHIKKEKFPNLLIWRMRG
jgi:hypothetical protein